MAPKKRKTNSFEKEIIESSDDEVSKLKILRKKTITSLTGKKKTITIL